MPRYLSTDPNAGKAVAAEPRASLEDRYRAAVETGDQQAQEELLREAQGREIEAERGTAAAAGPALSILGAGAAGGLAGAGGMVGGAFRAATSPAGLATIQAANAVRRGEGPGGIAYEAAEGYFGGKGLGKVLEFTLPKALKSKLAHALVRGAKVATESAKAAPAAAKAAKTLQSVTVATPKPEQVTARILELSKAGLSRGQMAEQLRSELAPGGRGIGTSYFGKMIDMVLEAQKAGAL